jgi:hypothetical protein
MFLAALQNGIQGELGWFWPAKGLRDAIKGRLSRPANYGILLGLAECSGIQVVVTGVLVLDAKIE